MLVNAPRGVAVVQKREQATRGVYNVAGLFIAFLFKWGAFAPDYARFSRNSAFTPGGAFVYQR